MKKTLKSINPVFGETIAEYNEISNENIDAIITEAHTAYYKWRELEFGERAGKMHKAGEILLQRKNDYAALMASEMGKPLTEGIAEIKKCAAACNYFAINAEAFLKPETVPVENGKGFIAFEPSGVILAIMPWNFPFWQAFRFIAPALMAGNAAVLKHASNVSGCSLAIENVLHDAGFPKAVFRSLLVSSSAVNSIIEHPLIKAVTLTGSNIAGKAVAAKAGEMLKKTVLELGGSDPYIILEDADLEYTVKTCVNSRLINNGQSCIAAKRFIVVKSLKKKFEELFVETMKQKKYGDPFDAETDLGPMARYDLRETLHKQVTESIAKGALCLLGGTLPGGAAAYYPPTVLTNVKAGMPAYHEELFGPVAAIIEATDEDDAIRIGNDNEYGLGAAVFSKDLSRAEYIAHKKLEAGSCFVNDFVKSDQRFPFGGIKSSGYGRELSNYGIKEFVNIKTVMVRY